MNSRLVRLLLRLSKETGTKYEDLVEASGALLKKQPRLTPDEIDRALRTAR